jgi:hypothetical protein
MKNKNIAGLIWPWPFSGLQKIFDYLYSMSASEILKEIDHLPLNEKLALLERAIRDIIRHNYEQQLTVAAETMENEYKTNNELTAFTSLDTDDFYETK